MRLVFVIGILAALALAGYVIFASSPSVENTSGAAISPAVSPVPESVETEASFAIFTNGLFRIFTAPMYHNVSPDVFIDASNPNVVHVKKVGITWNDFFKTLPFSLTKDCLTTGTGQTFCTTENQRLEFYINGERSPNALDQIIHSGDKLLVTYGASSETQIRDQLQQIPEAQ